MEAHKTTRNEIIKKAVPIFMDYPVRKAILFGSYAKEEAREQSDIDLYVDTGGDLLGLDFVGLIEALSIALGKDVDLIDKSHIEENSAILNEIEKEGVVIYEKSTDYS